MTYYTTKKTNKLKVMIVVNKGCSICYAFFISPGEDKMRCVNGKYLTEAKRKEFKELIREIVVTLLCSSNLEDYKPNSSFKTRRG